MEWLRRHRLLVGVLAAVAVLALAAAAWYLASPLFIDEAVDEAFPFDLPAAADIPSMDPDEMAAAMDAAMQQVDEAFVAGLPPAQQADLEERLMALSAAMPDHEMTEPPLVADWTLVAEGRFQNADDFHQGEGRAAIFQQGEARVLRFEAFRVTNGPDLHVLLVENIGGASHDALGATVDLGSLKGNVGNQNYDIPDDVDLTRYAGVMIYCQPFHVVFATASFGGR